MPSAREGESKTQPLPAQFVARHLDETDETDLNGFERQLAMKHQASTLRSATRFAR